MILIRAIRCGFSTTDLERMNLGLLFDCFTELEYDERGYIREATQHDFDTF